MCPWVQMGTGAHPCKIQPGGVAWVWVSPDGIFSCPCSCRASVSLSIKWASCPGALRCFETACGDVACARHLPRDKVQLSVTQGSPGAGVALSLPPQVPQEPRGHGQRPLPGASLSLYATAETQRTRCTSASPCFPRWGQTQSHFLLTPQFILSSQALPGKPNSSKAQKGREGLGVFPKGTRCRGCPRTKSNCRSRGRFGDTLSQLLGTGMPPAPYTARNSSSADGPGTDAGCCCWDASTIPGCWRGQGRGGYGGGCVGHA